MRKSYTHTYTSAYEHTHLNCQHMRMGVWARCQNKEIMIETETADLIDGFGQFIVKRFCSSIFYGSMNRCHFWHLIRSSNRFWSICNFSLVISKTNIISKWDTRKCSVKSANKISFHFQSIAKMLSNQIFDFFFQLFHSFSNG